MRFLFLIFILMNNFAKILLFRDNPFNQSRAVFQGMGAPRWCIHIIPWFALYLILCNSSLISYMVLFVSFFFFCVTVS